MFHGAPASGTSKTSQIDARRPEGINRLRRANALTLGASYFNGNPRAKRLMGKELLVEFAWCEGYAETLSRFTNMLGPAVAFPDRCQWPGATQNTSPRRLLR